MANIKSVSVKIGADTKDFINGLKQADKEITSTTKLANELENGLKLKYNEKNFVQAQKQMQNALQLTADKAQQIRDRMKSLEESGRVNTADYEKLELELAKTENTATKLETKLKEIDKIKVENATKGFTDLSKKLETTAKKMTAVSVAAGGLLAGMTKLAKDAVATGDEIATNADKYNLSAEAIQRWNYIALQSDVPSEILYKSMVKVREAVGTKLAGQTNNATKSIESLGLSLENIGTNEQAFTKIVDALSNIKNSTTQAYLSNEIFGEEIATNLIPLLKQGGDAIKGYAEEFEGFDYLTNEQVANLAEVDKQLNETNTQIENSKTQLGIALLPVLQTLSDLLKDYIVPAIENVTNWFRNLSPEMQKIITGGLLLTAALSPVFMILSKIVGIVPTLVKLFTSLKGASFATAAGFASLAGAIGLAFDLIGNWKQMSTIEKVLKTLAIAALTAAAAMTIFHASATMGVALGVITAAIVAGVAAVKAAGKSIGVDADISDANSVAKYARSDSNYDYNIPNSNNGGYTTYNEDNSQYNIEITMNSTGNLDYDARTLADEVIKEITVRKQALGR